MDVDTPADLAVQPAPMADEDQTNWEIEKSEYVQAQFNLNRELIDLRERLEDVSRQNGQMADELSRHSEVIKENSTRQRILENERNKLTDENLELQSTVARLKIEKGEQEAAVVNATKTAQAALVETFALKDQIKQLSSEKISLSHAAETTQQEKQSIEVERQKYVIERNLHAESKRWLMQEVAERDNRVSSLRLELSNKDVEGANQRLQYESQINLLKAQVESLNEKLDMTKFNNADLLKRIENTELSKASEIANLEEEIRCQAELHRVLKHSMEETKNAADHFKDKLDAQDGVLAEVRRVLQEHQAEMENERAVHADKLRERDEELAQTRAELAKVNEMMKSMSDVKLNVSEEELAELAPAAAEAVRFLKGGQSLSSLVLEHARVRGRLAESEEESLTLRTTLQDLLETIEKNKPHLISQRMVNDELFDKSNRFEKQLDEAEQERKGLVSQRDAAQRDLAYVRAELEKYQRDYEFITKRNAELLYTVERQNRRAQDPNWNEQKDEALFQSIVHLQRRNVELESDIENAKTAAAQAAMNAQSEEMAQLRADLAVTKKSEAELKTRVDQAKTAFENLKAKTEHFKDLVRDSVSASEAKAARLKAEEAVAAKMVADATIERLRAQIEELKTDTARREQELLERVQNSESNINGMNETNIQLKAMLEAQKTNTTALQQEYEAALKERDTTMEALRKAMNADAEKERRFVDLGRQTLEATDQSAILKVRVRSLEDELEGAKSQVNILTIANNGQRALLEKEEQVRQSYVEISKRLSRVECEMLQHGNTQLDAVRMERDNLKSMNDRLSEQVSHTDKEAKLTQQRLENELKVLRSRLIEKEQQISRDEVELVDLRSKLTSVQNQFTDAAGMTPDRLKREYMQLKTKTQMLESELDEAKRKLMEAEAAQKRMDAQQEISASHSNVLEESLKQSEQMGAMERERLAASAKIFEERAQKLTDQLAQNQLELSELKAKYEEATFNAEKEANDLRRQIEVANLNLNVAKRDLELANSTLISLQNDATQNASLIEQHSSIVRQFTERVAELETAQLLLKTELDNKFLALVAETDAKKQADEMREYVERELRKKTEERKLLEIDSQRKQAEFEEKLNQLSQQYEMLSSTIPVGASSMDSTEDNPQSMINNLQSLLHIVRQTKDEATERAMNAELEMARLRAETALFEKNRNELLQKIRDLETEKIATAASLVERSKLIDQVQSLSAVHTLNAQLTDEKTKLQAQIDQIQKAKTDVDRQVALLTAKTNEQNIKIAASNQEAMQRKREIDHLKQQIQTTGRGPAAALQTQIEQLKTQLTAVRQEAATAAAQAKAAADAKLRAEESEKALQVKFNQTRALAIKYRGENAEYKKMADSAAAGGAADPNAAARIAALTKAHNEEKEALKKQIDDQKAELDAQNVKVMRMNMLETRVKKSASEIADLKEQNEKLAEANRKLVQSRSVSATDVESKTATPSAPKPQPIVRQTPAKAPEPSTTGPLTRAVQPDQAGVGNFGGKRMLFGGPPVGQSSVNVVPPAPAPTNLAKQQLTSPEKRQLPPTIPNEPIDIIPPVPSDNVPVVTDPGPSTNTFGSMLPVPHTFQTSARVPTQSLFSSSSTTTVQPIEKKTLLPNIDSAPNTPGGNVTVSQATSSLTSTHPPPTDILALPEESVMEGSAGQSSLVSGSVDQQQAMNADLVANDGESRDSTNVGGVSSSDVRRKRTAHDFDANEAKRHRESPNETVTSSETRQQINLAEIPELDDEEEVLALEHDSVSDEDPTDHVARAEHDVVDLENDEEVLDEEMEGEEGDDESYANDEEEYEDEEEKPQQEDGDDDDVVVLSDDDGPEDENDAESLNDVEEEEVDDVEEIDVVADNDDIDEVLGGEDSQPSLDDQDREAASAVEEAEDEGRDPLGVIDEPLAPADPTGASGIGSSGRMGQELQRDRLPTGLRQAEREDQCSSSNETNEERPPMSARNVARQRAPVRGGRQPTRGVYQPGRGRGRGGGAM